MVELIYNNEVGCRFNIKKVRKVVEMTSRFEKKISGVVEITVVGEAKIKKLNTKFRGKNRVTDVLSFSMREGEIVAGPVFGELYLCFSKISQQAKEFGVRVEEEFYRMIVHGLLHLAGHDHILENDAKKMFAIQEKVIKRL